jgi:hypothetical protein
VQKLPSDWIDPSKPHYAENVAIALWHHLFRVSEKEAPEMHAKYFSQIHRAPFKFDPIADPESKMAILYLAPNSVNSMMSGTDWIPRTLPISVALAGMMLQSRTSSCGASKLYPL